MEVTWDKPTNPLGSPIDTGQRALTTSVEEAERLVKASNYAQAVAKLLPLRTRLSGYGHKLLLQAVAAARDWPCLVDLTQEPGSIEELVMGVDARVRKGDGIGAKAHVDQHATRLSLPDHQVRELLMRIASEEGLHKK